MAKKKKSDVSELIQGVKLPKDGRFKAGTIGVDAGLCWIGDPCYVFHKKGEYPGDTLPKALGKSWSEFVENLYNGRVTSEPAHQFCYDAGHEGLGVLTSTGYGDGEYPVFVTMEGGRVKKIEVQFF